MNKIPHLHDYTFIGLNSDFTSKITKINLKKYCVNFVSAPCIITAINTQKIEETLFREGNFPDESFRYICRSKFIDNGNNKTLDIEMMNGAIIKITAEDFEYEEN